MKTVNVMRERNFKVISSSNFRRFQDRLLLVHTVRTILLFVVLAAVVTYQFFQSEFINSSVWLPVYLILVPSFLLNSIYLLYFEKLEKYRFLTGFFLGLDALAITLLMHFTGLVSSVFLFLYLINLVLGGLVLTKLGALTLVVFTSALYSWMLIFQTDIFGQSLYITTGVNNVIFFAIAHFSAVLGEQINFMGTRLRESEAEVKGLQDLNRLIVDNIASGMMILDETLSVQMVNSSAQKILQDISLRGRPVRNIFPEVFQEIQAGHVAKVKGSIRRLEVELELAGEQSLVLETLISPLIDPQGEWQGYLLLFQDLTEFKRLEKQARQQDKLAAVGQLAAGIAHEIRNPLASISGSIQLLVANPEKLKDEDLKLMQIVLREIDRLNLLITEFLEFVRPDVHANDSVDVNVVMTEVMEMVKFNKGLPKTVKQALSLESNTLIVGHRDKLKQAFLNIVINAYQAMAETASGEIRVRTFDDGNKVNVIISDNGPGMSSKVLEKIFEPFHTTKAKGTGLGLAITHKIIESHGAKIFVDSRLGEGATFTVEFPGEKARHPMEEAQRKQA